MKVLLGILLLCFVAAINAAPRIIGGSDAPDGKYPYQVSLRYYGSHFCGGSILNKRWILTAAHCVQRQSPSNIKVHVGSNKLSGDDNDVYQAEYLTYHEDYNGDLIVNDIALIRVDKEIKFSEKVQPIALPSFDFSKVNTSVVLTGWGSTRLGGNAPNNLQQIDLKIYSQKSCKEAWSNYYSITSSHICTLTKVGEGACHGDSGGPLAAEGVQVGIVSFGRPCGVGEPDVFTRVYSFLDWIQKEQEKFY